MSAEYVIASPLSTLHTPNSFSNYLIVNFQFSIINCQLVWYRLRAISSVLGISQRA